MEPVSPFVEDVEYSDDEGLDLNSNIVLKLPDLADADIDDREDLADFLVRNWSANLNSGS